MAGCGAQRRQLHGRVASGVKEGRVDWFAQHIELCGGYAGGGEGGGVEGGQAVLWPGGSSAQSQRLHGAFRSRAAPRPGGGSTPGRKGLQAPNALHMHPADCGGRSDRARLKGESARERGWEGGQDARVGWAFG
eukprot:scaffold22980_cov114-Isochrysis_galbana.AAC.5